MYFQQRHKNIKNIVQHSTRPCSVFPMGRKEMTEVAFQLLEYLLSSDSLKWTFMGKRAWKAFQGIRSHSTVLLVDSPLQTSERKSLSKRPRQAITRDTLHLELTVQTWSKNTSFKTVATGNKYSWENQCCQQVSGRSACHY